MLNRTFVSMIKTTVDNLQQLLLEHYSTSESRTLMRCLLNDILNIPPHLMCRLDEVKCSEEDTQRLHNAVIRLLRNEPLEHIVGRAHFFGLELEVSNGVLIPRPETEELVEVALTKLKEIKKPVVIDLCTGSGCIAISIALEKGKKVYAMDISEEAEKITQRNASNLGADVSFIRADLLSDNHEIPTVCKHGLVDLVISNPPYVMDREREEMEENVLLYEPRLALFVPDNDPLIFYRTIAEKAITWLKPGGWLMFEINQALGMETVKEVLSHGFENAECLRDMQGRDRIIIAQKKMNKKSNQSSSAL